MGRRSTKIPQEPESEDGRAWIMRRASRNVDVMILCPRVESLAPITLCNKITSLLVRELRVTVEKARTYLRRSWGQTSEVGLEVGEIVDCVKQRHVKKKTIKKP